jgi:hypothetical protein
MRSIGFAVSFVLGLVSAFPSLARAERRIEVIDGSSCRPNVFFANGIGGFVGGQGQLLFGPVTAVCSLVMGNHLFAGADLNWDASDLKWVYVDFINHTVPARLTARICFRALLSFVNICGPSVSFTASTFGNPTYEQVFPPPPGFPVPYSGAVIINVDANSTFTLLDVNPYWIR